VKTATVMTLHLLLRMVAKLSPATIFAGYHVKKKNPGLLQHRWGQSAFKG